MSELLKSNATLAELNLWGKKTKIETNKVIYQQFTLFPFSSL